MSRVYHSTKDTSVSRRTLILTALAFLLFGGIAGFILTHDKPSDKTVGPIPSDRAAGFAHKHQNSRNWRAQSTGIWYTIDEMENTVKTIKSLINSELKAPDNYSWQFGVIFGADKRKNPASNGSASKDGLLTMFMPVLVKNGGFTQQTPDPESSNKVIDFFEVRRYKTDNTRTPGWEAGNNLTYKKLWDGYFAPFESKLKPKKDSTCPSCLIFDEGNMFP